MSLSRGRQKFQLWKLRSFTCRSKVNLATKARPQGAGKGRTHDSLKNIDLN
jgi:hypothetical protein